MPSKILSVYYTSSFYLLGEGDYSYTYHNHLNHTLLSSEVSTHIQKFLPCICFNVHFKVLLFHSLGEEIRENLLHFSNSSSS